MDEKELNEAVAFVNNWTDQGGDWGKAVVAYAAAKVREARLRDVERIREETVGHGSGYLGGSNQIAGVIAELDDIEKEAKGLESATFKEENVRKVSGRLQSSGKNVSELRWSLEELRDLYAKYKGDLKYELIVPRFLEYIGHTHLLDSQGKDNQV